MKKLRHVFKDIAQADNGQADVEFPKTCNVHRIYESPTNRAPKAHTLLELIQIVFFL